MKPEQLKAICDKAGIGVRFYNNKTHDGIKYRNEQVIEINLNGEVKQFDPENDANHMKLLRDWWLGLETHNHIVEFKGQIQYMIFDSVLEETRAISSGETEHEAFCKLPEIQEIIKT